MSEEQIQSDAGSEGTADSATPQDSLPAEVMDQWEALGSETTPAAAEAEGSGEAESTAEAETDDAGDKEAGKDGAAGNGDGKAAAAEKPGEWTPTEAQLHAIERSGYKLEDLAGLPDKGRTFAEKAEKNWRDLGSRWAQLGATRTQSGTESPAAGNPAAAAAAANPAQAGATPDLVSQFGIDPKVWGADGAQALASVLNKVVSPVMRELEGYRAQAKQRERDALRSQVNTVFDRMAGEFADYGDVKGDHSKLTPTQKQARERVLSLADRIATGAAMEGVNLSPEEAIGQAHDALTAGLRVQTERKKIAAQLTARQRQLVSRPGSRAGASAQTNPEEVAADTWEKGMQALQASA